MIYGYVLSSNKRMLDLCRDLGFTVEYLSEEESRVHLRLK